MQILLERSHQSEGMPNPEPMKRSAQASFKTGPGRQSTSASSCCRARSSVWMLHSPSAIWRTAVNAKNKPGSP